MEPTSENLRKNTFVCYNHVAERRYRNILFGAQNAFTKEQDDSAVFAENRVASDMTRIRIGQPQDIDSIVAFNRAMAVETEQKQLPLPVLQAGVRAVFTNPQHGFYVIAETENEVIASLLVTREWSDCALPPSGGFKVFMSGPNTAARECFAECINLSKKKQNGRRAFVAFACTSRKTTPLPGTVMKNSE